MFKKLLAFLVATILVLSAVSAVAEDHAPVTISY